MADSRTTGIDGEFIDASIAGDVLTIRVRIGTPTDCKPNAKKGCVLNQKCAMSGGFRDTGLKIPDGRPLKIQTVGLVPKS